MAARQNPARPAGGTARRATPRIAYFSMEVGVESALHTYSGGLGVLAGDTLKAAADLALPVVGVTLVHREGYFRQSLDEDGRQTDAPDVWSPEERLREVPERVTVEVAGRAVRVRAWEYEVRGQRGGVVPVYLLDTDLPENDEEDRALTDRLYGGDDRYRLLQETVLGVAGPRLLAALGHRRIHTWHMNEGHSALVPVELLYARARGRKSEVPTAQDEAWVQGRCVFTTHTPVPAGHDRFEEALVEDVLGEEWTERLRGRGLEDGVLNMTRLALHFARFVNGVAMRHAQISREMFPGREVAAITNGVHVPTWTCPPMGELFDRYVPSWREDPLNLRHACAIPLGALREARRAAKGRLIDAVRQRTGRELSLDVLTLGFARRATPYKRADLLFEDRSRLLALAKESGGLQVVYAGKAHPRDTGGQDLIRTIHRAGQELAGTVDVVYLENYDMELGGLLTSGVDVWLNNPEKPKEASGTSGMKAALNGVPNLSVLDGWWIEGHVEGVTGWSIGGAWDERPDRARAAGDIYARLADDILPLYLAPDDRFDAIRRHAIALNGPHFSARRMMHQYVERAYGPGGVL
ncbi:MAG: alpha-glucan family phosphorylase [Gemmatimonadota bacterium]|jgi:starch phosphorylase